MNRHLYLVAYDISNSKRLKRMLDVVKDYASGGQKSAFECYLFSWERRELINRVTHTMDLDKDAFLIISLSEPDKVRTLGVAVQPIDEIYTYLG